MDFLSSKETYFRCREVKRGQAGFLPRVHGVCQITGRAQLVGGEGEGGEAYVQNGWGGHAASVPS